jgi:hypothetical protein
MSIALSRSAAHRKVPIKNWASALLRPVRTSQRAVPTTSRYLAVWITLLSPFVAQAHLGSPNVYFEGPAGPYPIRVVIQPPGVVPGLAQIHVRARSDDVENVTVLPVRWNAGTRGAPAPDVAKPVSGETNLFTAQLWLMDSGAYSVFVDVTGPRGRGTAIVPFNSLALERREMSRSVSLLFLGVGCLLVALLVCVVGAAIREAVVPPGVEPTPARRWFARLGMALSLLIAGGALFFGKGWWDKVDQTFRRHRLYQPPAITSTVTVNSNGKSQLALRIESGNRRQDSTPLIPDHGQLMHLFLIRQQGDAFAHLHPVRDSESRTFSTRLPALPDGEYQLYADITHESGFSQTLTNVLRLSAASMASPDSFTSPDDSMTVESPQSLATTRLPGSFVLTPTFAPPFRADEEITLAFNLITETGAPAPLEPYLGMYGHLVIQHADGSVFTHLHPLGSISMASQRRFAEREHAGYLANQSLELLCSPASTTLSFPYAFPKPGPYRLWLQTKLQGQIRTAAYQLEVQ